MTQGTLADLDEESAVLGIKRVQPASIVEEPCPRGAAMEQLPLNLQKEILCAKDI